MTKDPVCGMQVNESQASMNNLCTDYQGKQFCFCSESCKRQFSESPERYAEQAA